jgi:hypothetical protein
LKNNDDKAPTFPDRSYEHNISVGLRYSSYERREKAKIELQQA